MMKKTLAALSLVLCSSFSMASINQPSDDGKLTPDSEAASHEQKVLDFLIGIAAIQNAPKFCRLNKSEVSKAQRLFSDTEKLIRFGEAPASSEEYRKLFPSVRSQFLNKMADPEVSKSVCASIVPRIREYPF